MLGENTHREGPFSSFFFQQLSSPISVLLSESTCYKGFAPSLMSPKPVFSFGEFCMSGVGMGEMEASLPRGESALPEEREPALNLSAPAPRASFNPRKRV